MMTMVMMRKQKPNNESEEENSIQGELTPQTEPSVKNISVKPCCRQKVIKLKTLASDFKKKVKNKFNS